MNYSELMTEETISKEPEAPPSASPMRNTRFRIGAGILIAVAVGLILWLALRDSGSSSSGAKLNASAVSAAQISQLAASVDHPVFWLGQRSGDTYELSRTSNGTIYLRYLPSGVSVGSNKPYLTVATYPFPGAYSALKTVSRQAGSTAIKLSHGGLGVVSSKYPESVHVAYPGVDYQIEVFDPTPGNATAAVASGALTAFGSLSGSASTGKPAATTVSGLRALARSLGHPVYWAGPKPGYRYEVSHGTSGNVYIRYLPAGVVPGTSQPYFTVATYPFVGAYAALQGLTKQKHAVTLSTPNGGLAVVDAAHPTSVHLAFPNQDYQVEVFDPSAVRVRQIVRSGQIKPIG